MTASAEPLTVADCGLATDDVFDIDTPLPSRQPQQMPDGVRQVLVNVPANMTDEAVSNALALGAQVSHDVVQGTVVVLFPQQVQGENGAVGVRVGAVPMPLLCPEDAQAVLEVVGVINRVNSQIAQAAQTGGPDALTARLSGTRVKEEAARQIRTMCAGDSSGMLIPTMPTNLNRHSPTGPKAKQRSKRKPKDRNLRSR
jgi:hypothetical protein